MDRWMDRCMIKAYGYAYDTYDTYDTHDTYDTCFSKVGGTAT